MGYLALCDCFRLCYILPTDKFFVNIIFCDYWLSAIAVRWNGFVCPMERLRAGFGPQTVVWRPLVSEPCERLLGAPQKNPDGAFNIIFIIT